MLTWAPLGSVSRVRGSEWRDELRPQPGLPGEGRGGGCTEEGAPASSCALSLAPLCHVACLMPFSAPAPYRLPQLWVSSCPILKTGIWWVQVTEPSPDCEWVSLFLKAHMLQTPATAGRGYRRAHSCCGQWVGIFLSRSGWPEGDTKPRAVSTGRLLFSPRLSLSTSVLLLKCVGEIKLLT